jgi:hypothetical protein
LGAFLKLQKSFVMPVHSDRLSVLVEQLASHWTDFHENLHLNIFQKFSRKFKFN